MDRRLFLVGALALSACQTTTNPHLSAGAQSTSDVAQAQRLLNALGYDAGVVDGLWRGQTRSALVNFLSVQDEAFDGVLDQSEILILEQAANEQGVGGLPTVDWRYRATSITFGGYDAADEPVYDMIRTISEIPDYGFNVVTLDFRCTGRRDNTVPDYYPLGWQLGCSIANRQILEEDGFASTRRDATSLAIDEARAAGLAVNLKPMFAELGRRFGEPDAAGYGTVPLDVFFEGNGSWWSGYRSIIVAVAEYAQANDAEYLTIGAELNNLNGSIENDPRWTEIIAEIRSLFSGQLIYNHNFNNQSDLRSISPQNVMRQVDIVGLNFFPTQLMDGRLDYTADEVAIALDAAITRQGRNMMAEAARLRGDLGVPIILSETHFPTWRGSANYMFRGRCDYQNAGRAGWQFTQGPLQAKTPSDEHGRILTNGFMLAFADEDWVYGADYLFWTVAHAYDERTDTREYGPCSSWLWNSDDGIRQMISEFHNTSDD